MSLEMLPDEILLCICSYLSPFDVLQAFTDLNTRLNYTIGQYRSHIDLTQVRYGEFNQYCDMLVQTDLGGQVRFLKLSNTTPVLQQIKLFTKCVWPLDQKLPNLEHLALIGPTDDELDLLIPQTKLLKKFIKLTVEGRSGSYNSPYSTLFVEKSMKAEDIEQQELRNLDGEKITALLEDVHYLTLNKTYRHYRDARNIPTVFPALVPPDHIFYDLKNLFLNEIDSDFCELLHSFLRQLLPKAPNLFDIGITIDGEGVATQAIGFILDCLEKPSMSIQKFSIEGEGSFYYDFNMESFVTKLPNLTSLHVYMTSCDEEIIHVINTCITGLKRILYLQLEESRYGPWTADYHSRTPESIATSDKYLWLKENTLLGCPIKGRPFHADFGYYWRIWL